MNFQDLYKKIADLDGKLVTESAVSECGDMPPAPMSPQTQPMTMTVNLNAQGEEDISSLMRLLTKVNPDMMPKSAEAPLPSISSGPELTIGGPGAKISSPADDIKGDMMKLLPLDDAEENEKEEDFRDATTQPDPEYKDVDAMTHDGNDLNKSKKTFPKVAGGDNPMQKTESEDLLSQIRAELQARLAEAKK